MKMNIIEALVKTGLTKSKSEARRLIKQGAVVIAYPIYKKKRISNVEELIK